MKFPVLFLDDDNNWLTLYSHYLDQANYSIESTTSLVYALERIKNFPYPVIISDLRLIGYGNTGGFRLLDKARKNNKFTKVIIITAYGGTGTAIAGKAIKKGAFRYLTKPVDFMELDECIKTAMLCWEQEIEECISLGFLRMDYISQLFTMSNKLIDRRAGNETDPGITKVFMSYAPDDKMDAQMIANILEKNGIPLCYERKQGESLKSLLAEIKKAMQDTAVILVILSKEAVNSGWVDEEVGAIVGRYEKNKKLKIIPVMIDDVDIPPLLAKNKTLDLQTNVNEKINELIQMIKDGN